MNKRLFIRISLLVILILMAFCIKFAVEWDRFLEAPIVPEGKSVYFILEPGATVRTVSNFLKNEGYLHHHIEFILFAKINGSANRLKAGEYEFKAGTTPKMLLKILVNGDVVRHHITFIEGWTFSKMINVIETAPRLTHTLKGKNKKDIMAILESNYKNPEGLFFPDTYRYKMGMTDLNLLKKSYQIMQEKLMAAWKQRAQGLPYKTPYQALIVASMIEKEASLPQERPLIAGVIINRLRKRMFLQIDPSVIYGLGDRFTLPLSPNELEIDTPYNTYLHKGLPPSPIAMPSEQSIQAALHPTKTRYLYFVAKGDGSHEFSQTLKEHDEAIKEYLKNQNVEPGLRTKVLK